jgi:hypothetical protein
MEVLKNMEFREKAAAVALALGVVAIGVTEAFSRLDEAIDNMLGETHEER